MSEFTVLLIFIAVFLGIAICFKVPVAYSLGLGAVVLFLLAGFPLKMLAQNSFVSLDSFPMLAIAFFVFAGVLMEYSGISRLLIDWIDSIVSRLRGSVGAVCVVASAAFGALTGSAMSTLCSIGKLMIPEMRKKGYSGAYAAAIAAASCFLGILIPPSAPGILYALAAECSIQEVWLATIGPGVVIIIGFVAINWFKRRKVESKPKEALDWGAYMKNIGKCTVNAFWALLMPVIIFGGIYGGIFTPTEAGAVCVVYGLAYFLFRKYVTKLPALKDMNVRKMSIDSSVTTAAISLLVCLAAVAGRGLSYSGISNKLAGLIVGTINNKYLFLLMVNLIFLFLGTFMEMNASVLIMTPLLLPAAVSFGIDPVHFGAIMIVNLCFGMLTPPFALGLFVSSKFADVSFGATVKESKEFMIFGLVSIALTTYVEPLVMWLPRLFK